MKLRKILALMLIMSLGPCAIEAAEQDIFKSPVWQENVSFEFVDYPIAKALDELIKPTGTSYRITYNARHSIPNLVIRTSREQALNLLARQAGFTYTVEDNKLLISPGPATPDVWFRYVNMDLTEAKLGDVLQDMLKPEGISFAIGSHTENLVVKPLKLKNVMLKEALGQLLEQAGATCNQQEKAGPFSGPSSKVEVVRIIPKPSPAPVTSIADLAKIDLISPHVTVAVTTDDKDPWKSRVSIDVKDAPLRSVADALFKSIRLNYSIEPNAGVLPVNSLKLTDVTILEAFDEVTRVTGTKFHKYLPVRRMLSGITLDSPKPLQSDGKAVDLDVRGMPLPKVMERLFKDTGLTYAIDPSVKKHRVTASLINVRFEDALDSLLKVVGLAYQVDEGVYRISPQPVVTLISQAP